MKLDMEKAYDLMDWNFVEGMLRDVGLPAGLIIVMRLIRMIHYRLLWNGEVTNIIH